MEDAVDVNLNYFKLIRIISNDPGMQLKPSMFLFVDRKRSPKSAKVQRVKVLYVVDGIMVKLGHYRSIR